MFSTFLFTIFIYMRLFDVLYLFIKHIIIVLMIIFSLGFMLKATYTNHLMNVHLKERPYKCRYGCELGKKVIQIFFDTC